MASEREPKTTINKREKKKKKNRKIRKKEGIILYCVRYEQDVFAIRIENYKCALCTMK